MPSTTDQGQVAARAGMAATEPGPPWDLPEHLLETGWRLPASPSSEEAPRLASPSARRWAELSLPAKQQRRHASCWPVGSYSQGTTRQQGFATGKR